MAARKPPKAEFLGRSVPEYSDQRLRGKLARHAVAAGREVVEKVLWLYYASRRPDVPRWAKVTIYAALAYFILPLDVVPDLVLGLGFTDDMAVLLAAVNVVRVHLHQRHRDKARDTLDRMRQGDPAAV